MKYIKTIICYLNVCKDLWYWIWKDNQPWESNYYQKTLDDYIQAFWDQNICTRECKERKTYDNMQQMRR